MQQTFWLKDLERCKCALCICQRYGQKSVASVDMTINDCFQKETMSTDHVNRLATDFGLLTFPVDPRPPAARVAARPVPLPPRS